MKRITCVAANFVLSWAIFSGAVYAQNVVTDWATIVQPALNTPAKLPAVQMVLRAMVQIAVYDSVVAIEGGYQPFAAAITASPGADVRAAVATAAYLTARSRVASSQFPALDNAYQTYMATIPAGAAKDEGVNVGTAAANVVVALRANDGMTNVVLYACSADPGPAGEFEPDGGCDTQPAGANVGQIHPFTFTKPARFRPGGPNPLTSNAYIEDFVETRDFGRSDSIIRSPEQTDIAYFWQAVDTHRGLTDLAISRSLDVRDTARFFAMVYTAAADANITGFEAKYFYRSWRPRTAIPRADADGNPDTDADPTWKPLITVNHPEYPSAHSYSTTAITDTVARFFGTNKVIWTLTASRTAIPQLVQTERTYYNLNALMREIYDARVWAGLHWRHSMLNGAQIGRKVSKYVSDNFFLPVP
jgi:PAP2 superfamily